MQSALCKKKKQTKKKHEKLVNVLPSISLQKSSVKTDDFREVAKHAVTSTSDNDGIAEESADYMRG